MHAPGFARLRLRHSDRSLAPLWTAKERIEPALHDRGIDLFDRDLGLVFFDTTARRFEGRNLDGWAKVGKSNDHRTDHVGLVVGVVIRKDGTPITCEVWPGNAADVKTLVPVVEGLQERFKIKEVIVACDRGMVSAANLEVIEEAGYRYVCLAGPGGVLGDSPGVRVDVPVLAGIETVLAWFGRTGTWRDRLTTPR